MKKILKIGLLLLLSYIVASSSCRDKYPGEPLVIRNNTNNRIYYWFAYWNNFPEWKSYHYLDTILPNIRPPGIFSISAQNSTVDGEIDPDWETIFSKLPAGKLSVYFFMEDPEKQEKWDSIITNNAYSRKDVTFQELVNNNYSIYYP